MKFRNQSRRPSFAASSAEYMLGTPNPQAEELFGMFRRVAEVVVVDAFHLVGQQMQKMPRHLQADYVQRIKAGDPKMEDRAAEVLREAVTRGELSSVAEARIGDAFKAAVGLECARYAASIGTRNPNPKMAQAVARGIEPATRHRLGEQLAILDEAMSVTASRIDSDVRIAKLREQAAQLRLRIGAIETMGTAELLAQPEAPELLEELLIEKRIAAVRKIARDLPTPPLKTAVNVEAAVMGYSHVIGLMGVGAGDALLERTLKAFEQQADPIMSRLRGYYGNLTRLLDEPELTNAGPLGEFMVAWRECAFARLEVGHKLAAALCLTDVPDMEARIKMPWPAFSIVIPDGLLGNLARVWVHDADGKMGTVHLLDRSGRPWRDGTNETSRMITNLIIGSALALSDPEAFKKEKHHSATHSTKNRRAGAPDFDQARYMLSAPVKVDLRPHVHEALVAEREGRKHTSPTVQFLVRGHWKNQAHGVGRLERKRIWIQPFWKGPEESRVLLRAYVAERQ